MELAYCSKIGVVRIVMPSMKEALWVDSWRSSSGVMGSTVPGRVISNSSSS